MNHPKPKTGPLLTSALISLLSLTAACGDAPREGDASSDASEQAEPSVTDSAINEQAASLTTVPINNPDSKSLSRLTRSQVIHSVEALLGAEAALGLADVLPELTPNGGYGNSGHAQAQPYNLVLGYDVAAKRVSTQIADWPSVFARYGQCAEQSCIYDFISSFGEAAFRRPLTAAELAGFEPIVTAAAELPLEQTAALIIRAMLQAPEFLYLFEQPTLDSYQLASRLAYFVSDGPPDAELYSKAKDGTITDKTVLSAEVARLLTLHGTRFAEAFAYDFFDLRKASQRTFGVAPELVPQLVDSAVKSFGALVAKDAPLSSVLTATEFVVNPETATYLAQDAPAGVLTPTENYPFMGLLTHPAILLAMSNAVEGSMVSRGQFMAGQLLCLPPVPPPVMPFSAEDVAGELPGNPTPRQEAEARLADPLCGGCHAQFESLAFGLNAWTGDGKYAANIRSPADGTINSRIGTITFAGHQELLRVLSKSQQFEDCFADHLLRYGLRHTQYPPEALTAVLGTAREGASELTFKGLLTAIVEQELFSQH